MLLDLAGTDLGTDVASPDLDVVGVGDGGTDGTVIAGGVADVVAVSVVPGGIAGAGVVVVGVVVASPGGVAGGSGFLNGSSQVCST